MGNVMSVCISEVRGTKKKQIDKAVLVKDWGIEGDAHAGSQHRDIDSRKSSDDCLNFLFLCHIHPFHEDLTTAGIFGFSFLAVTRRSNHLTARFREHFGAGAADAAGTTGDQDGGHGWGLL